MKLIILCLILLSLTLYAAKEQPVVGIKQETASLDFKRIPLRELLQFVAESMNLNVIMSDSVTGSLSVHFHNVTWSQALDNILEMSGLVKKQKENILFIATANEFAARQKSFMEASPYKTITIKLQHTDVNALVAILKSQPDLLTSMAKININQEENSLWIKENVANIPLLINYLKQLDKSEKQILVAAKIVNVDDKKMHELGMSVHQGPKINSSHDLHFSLPQQGASSFSIAIASPLQNQLLNLQLDALESTGHSKLIADPRIITLNRKTATIEAGEDIPYQESTSSGATNVSFKKAALGLKVTPTALPDGRIKLDLEINQNKTSPLVVNGTPSIQTQELKTQVIVRDGQTVILGGIFETSSVTLSNHLPIICKLPVVGSLLSYKEKQLVRKELLIFVSPHLIEE